MAPIRGLTDTARPAFPRLGKLRKGGPKGERRPGEDLSYWRFTTDNPAIQHAFAESYGSEPQELDVLLPYAAIDDNFSAWKEHWMAGGLQHRCDGEVCTIWLTPDGTYSDEPKVCPGGCKEVGRLEVILPLLIRAGFVGYVTLETHSLNDIIAIQSALLATKEHRGYEDMRGIGFVLRRVEETISTPGTDGKRVRRKKWLVKLEPAAQWVRARLEMAQHRAMLPMDSQTGEVIDSVAREVSSEQAIAQPQEAPESEQATDKPSPGPEVATENPPETPEPKQLWPWRAIGVPPTQTRERSAAEERTAVALARMFYMRWDPLFPEDKDHEIAHREFRVASLKDLYGEVTPQQMAPLLDTLDLAMQNTLTLQQLKELLGLVYLIDWFAAGYTREGGVEAIARYIEQQAGTPPLESAGQQPLEMPSELAADGVPSEDIPI